jgi:hypothetical protein
MYDKYDYVIIGGGPCGLTVALYLSKMGKKCCIIDKNKSLGGCHRVTRVDGLFTEHGPRVYSSAYLNFKQVLSHLRLEFNTLFTKYNFNISSIQNESFSNFTFREKVAIGKELVKLVFHMNKRDLEFMSVREFASRNNFSSRAQDYMDRICRLTDGAGYDKTNMYQFIQLINQNFFYELYQPKNPNDKVLFRVWESVLLDLKVDIFKNCDVRGIEGVCENKNDGLKNLKKVKFTKDENDEEIEGLNVVCCIPPRHFIRIAPKIATEMWGVYNRVNMYEWSEFNSYINNIPVSFHWSEKIKLPKVWGFPRDDWGIAFIVLSEYMNADGNMNNNETVISTCVTRQDVKSSVTGKTMQESNEEEIVSEVFRQLKISFPELPEYERAIVHPNVKNVNGKWVEDDTAYVNTYKLKYISSFHPQIPGFYFVGTHNGYSYYNFTSMESAVTNAMEFVNMVSKDNKKGDIIMLRKPFEMVDMIRLLIILVIILCLYYYYK